MKLEDLVKEKIQQVGLFYCNPGGGKSTLLGIIGEQSKGKTLVISVDGTFVPTMAKREIVKDFSKIDVKNVDSINTWNSLIEIISELKTNVLDYENICVDNISELERAMLADLGRQGKNKGVPAQADYQYMQFKMLDLLRFLKNTGKNIYLTAWEENESFMNPDGSTYTQVRPKINHKIVDNVCGICNIVGRIIIGNENKRGLVLSGTQNIYAKNQVDTRNVVNVLNFVSQTEKSVEENIVNNK